MPIAIHEDDHKKFLDYLLIAQYGTSDREQILQKGNKLDYEASAIFEAIQSAFTSQETSDNLVLVPQNLVMNLAACAWVGRLYSPDVEPKWNEHDYVLSQSLRWLYASAREAVIAGRTRKGCDNETLYGCLELPSWFVEKHIQEGEERRQYLRAHRARFPFPLHEVAK